MLGTTSILYIPKLHFQQVSTASFPDVFQLFQRGPTSSTHDVHIFTRDCPEFNGAVTVSGDLDSEAQLLDLSFPDNKTSRLLFLGFSPFTPPKYSFDLLKFTKSRTRARLKMCISSTWRDCEHRALDSGAQTLAA